MLAMLGMELKISYFHDVRQILGWLDDVQYFENNKQAPLPK